MIDGMYSGVALSIPANSSPASPVVRGLTIEHGQGAGIEISGSSPTIEGDVTQDNLGCDSGGGIVGYQSSP
jgi:hypothetical protein